MNARQRESFCVVCWYKKKANEKKDKKGGKKDLSHFLHFSAAPSI